MPSKEVRDILNKYGTKIESQLNDVPVSRGDYTREYVWFKQEMAPSLGRYEKWCHSLGNIVKLKVSEKDAQSVRKDLEIAHIDVEPWQALTLAVISFVVVFLVGLFISVAITFIRGGIEYFPILFFVLSLVVALFLFYFVKGYPKRLANSWRLKASSQMVPAILYIVVYMRHTSNLEKAIAFAAEHLEYPLALDFKKVFYDLEIGKFSTIKESLDNYLEVWRDYSIEFIESFHLIESSLFEPDDNRRISVLEKSLQVVLDGVYDKMLKFTHEVRGPLTNVYMLGVVLPTLALALLPLASAMLGDVLREYHVFILFNLIIPFFVFFLVDNILFLRPGGYGETSLLERNPLYPEYESKRPYVLAALICLPFLVLGFLPFIFQYTALPDLLGLQNDYSFSDLGLEFFGEENIFGFISNGQGGFSGPYGILALFLSMFIPFSIALFFILSFQIRTKNLILERNKTKQLEKEFNSSLFQLGNRLGNGMPPELAFGKVAESTRGLQTEDFFKRVNYNIHQMGMSVEQAIFDSRRGALVLYPSELIATSMRVLIESAKKGLNIAAVSLMSISQYVKNIQKITDRLRDMLAEIISDMRSNMTFLAPLLSGVVIGLAAMISTILIKLKNITGAVGGEGAIPGFSNLDSILTIFQAEKMVSPFYLQLAIGIYLIQISFILTSALVTINSGQDRLEKTANIGKNLRKAIAIYLIVAGVAILGLFFLASIVLGGLI
jgi:Flp pilus assembly protein TadB